MDLSNEADIKGSPETKSNEDSGVEVKIVNKNYLANSNLYFSKIKLKIKICFPQKNQTMEVDEKADSEVNTPVVERKEAEKRKRSSSRYVP